MYLLESCDANELVQYLQVSVTRRAALHYGTVRWGTVENANFDTKYIICA